MAVTNSTKTTIPISDSESYEIILCDTANAESVVSDTAINAKKQQIITQHNASKKKLSFSSAVVITGDENTLPVSVKNFNRSTNPWNPGENSGLFFNENITINNAQIITNGLFYVQFGKKITINNGVITVGKSVNNTDSTTQIRLADCQVEADKLTIKADPNSADRIGVVELKAENIIKLDNYTPINLLQGMVVMTANNTTATFRGFNPVNCDYHMKFGWSGGKVIFIGFPDEIPKFAEWMVYNTTSKVEIRKEVKIKLLDTSGNPTLEGATTSFKMLTHDTSTYAGWTFLSDNSSVNTPQSIVATATAQSEIEFTVSVAFGGYTANSATLETTPIYFTKNNNKEYGIDIPVRAYGKLPLSISNFDLRGSDPQATGTYFVSTDTSIEQTIKATVDAYTEIDTLEKLYDRFVSWSCEPENFDYGTTSAFKLINDNGILDFGDANLVLTNSGSSALEVNKTTNTITVKVPAGGLVLNETKVIFNRIKTTGSITGVDKISPLIPSTSSGGSTSYFTIEVAETTSTVTIHPTFDDARNNTNASVTYTGKTKYAYGYLANPSNYVFLRLTPTIVEDFCVKKVEKKATIQEIKLFAGDNVQIKEIEQMVTNTDIQTAKGEIVAEINANEVKIDAVKVQTDKFKFTGDNVDAVAKVVSDKTEYTLTAADKTAIAVAVESAILDENDSRKVLNAIVGAIGNTNVDQVALVGAIRADLERAGGAIKTIPTNPLLTNDARLNNLDAKISEAKNTEAEIQAAIIALAQSEKDKFKATIPAEIDTNIKKINGTAVTNIADFKNTVTELQDAIKTLSQAEKDKFGAITQNEFNTLMNNLPAATKDKFKAVITELAKISDVQALLNAMKDE